MEDKDKDVKEDLLRRKTEAILVPSGGPKSGVQVNLKRSSLPVEFHRLPSFSQVDVDGNGKIDFQEFKSVFPGIPEDEVIEMFNQVDVDHDGQLDRVEFETWKTKAVDFARSLILPRNVFQDQNKERDLALVGGEGYKAYRDLYNCTPPPIFMFAITLIEIGVFLYHWHYFSTNGETLTNYGPPPIHSVLIYHPERRHEAWRYLTYVFIHSGYMHIINNVVVQLLLGVLLEIAHKWWRVLIIYFAGVLAGSLATSVWSPYTYLAGASGGVYALIFAHMSTTILNWPEMERPGIRVLLFSLFAVYDVGTAFYYQYVLGKDTIVGYPAHLGGGVAGLLTGIYVLKNVKWEPWEAYLWYASVLTASALVLFAVAWNVFNPSYYPQTKY